MKIEAKNWTGHLAIASVFCILVLALGDPVRANDIYTTQYEMSADPSTALGVLDGSSGDFNGNGILTVGPGGSGSTFTTLGADQVMEFIDSPSTSGKRGYYFAHSPAVATVSFTVDMRVKVVSGVAPGSVDPSRSASFSGGSDTSINGGRNRGMRLNTGSVQFVNATGAVATGTVNLTTAFVRLRVAYNATTDMYSCYNLDTAATLCSPFFGGGTGADQFVGGTGGYSIGTLDGDTSNTTDSHYYVDYYRILIGTAHENATDVIDQITPPSCVEAVSPAGTQTKTGYELGATNAPIASVDLGATDVSDGLSASNNSGDGIYTPTTIGGRSCHQSNAGPYMYFAVADSRIFNGSSPAVSFGVDYFDTGTQSLTLDYDGVGDAGYTGVALVTLTNTNTWKHVDVAVTNAEFANGETGASDFRIHGASTFYIDVVTITETNITVKYTVSNLGAATFNWTASEVDSLGTTPVDYPWLTLSAAGGSLTSTNSADVIATLSTASLTAGTYTAYIKFTDSCSTDVLIRRIDLNVVGCSMAILEPKVRVRGPCDPTATTIEAYTIKNNGAHNWTGYNAVEDPEDDDWMTVSYTSSPVVQFATATVTATIDWSQVPAPGNLNSTIKFGATCDGGSTFVYESPTGTAPMETVNVLDTTPAPVKIMYNGDTSPSNANSAGTGYKFFLWSGSDQGTITADGQADDGLAYLLNDAGGAGLKTKWESVANSDPGNGSVPAMTINRYVGATAKSRLKVTATSGTLFQYNFGIQNAAGAIGAFCYWGGATNIIMESARGVSAAPAGDANYHIIRVTSQDTNVTGLGIVVKMYLDENSTPVLTITNGAASSGDSNIDGIAFGAASSAESATVYFDWVWGTNAGAFAPGEEVACIGSLVCGCSCNTPKVDIDGDGDVDMDDFGEFQKCYTGTLTGSPPPLSAACDCFDHDNDNDIDTSDFNHFVNCETGASVPWVTSVPCPN